MIRLFSLLALVLLSTEAATSGSAGGRLHVERSFTITLNARPDAAARAFGAVAEERWAPGFEPLFAYPNPPSDVEGAVFTVRAPKTQIWLLQTWDMVHHVVRYVAVDPGVKITALVIRVAPFGVDKSRATVTYDRTSLSSAGDAEVARFAKMFVSEAPQWERAINGYLAEAGAR
jgi:hypothetical protein